jgi:hypothetical protein
MLRDHTEELARGEAPHVFAATDAYAELQETAQALRLHFDSPNTDDEDKNATHLKRTTAGATERIARTYVLRRAFNSVQRRPV